MKTEPTGYVEEYFDRHAREWLEQAYHEGQLPVVFPLGDERIRLALHGIALRPDQSVVDLGCGGGQLCVHAARLGARVTGVDIAPGMVAAAEELRGRLPIPEADRIRLVTAPFDANGLPEGAFDAATALGLIEYLPTDDGLLLEARRLLRSGGRLAVSCRNRLFSLQSANAFTAREQERGAAPVLLEELRERLARTEPDTLRRLADELANAAEDLRAGAGADAADEVPTLFDHRAAFEEERRSHTPAGLERVAAAVGFRCLSVLGLHPHPLPPLLERISPRVYNRLAVAWQRAFEDSPLALAYCSSFVAVLERED